MKIIISEAQLKLFEQTPSNLEIEETVRNHHHGQIDLSLIATVNDKKVGYIDFSFFQGEVHIDFIEIFEKRKGYGAALIDDLAKRYGYNNINWGMVTDDGAPLKKAMDAKYGERTIENKNLDPELVEDALATKSPELVRLFNNLVKYGHKKAFDQFQYDWDELRKVDVNDVIDISRLVKGSVENELSPEDEPPEWAYEIIENFKK